MFSANNKAFSWTGKLPSQKNNILKKKSLTQKQKPSVFWQANSLLLCLMESSEGGGLLFAHLPVMWRSPFWACEKGSGRKINTSSV